MIVALFFGDWGSSGSGLSDQTYVHSQLNWLHWVFSNIRKMVLDNDVLERLRMRKQMVPMHTCNRFRSPIYSISMCCFLMMSSFICGVNLCCTQKLRADGRNTQGFQMKLSPEDCVHTDYSCGDEMTACGINCPVVRNERAGGMSFQVFQQKLKGFCVRRSKKTLISDFLSKFSFVEYQIKNGIMSI